MKTILIDEKCEAEITLAQAVSAKNVLQNCSGNSPNEFVLGFNINTPISTDKLAALEYVTTSDIEWIYTQHKKALQKLKARENM